MEWLPAEAPEEKADRAEAIWFNVNRAKAASTSLFMRARARPFGSAGEILGGLGLWPCRGMFGKGDDRAAPLKREEGADWHPWAIEPVVG